jgi:hypothetical protein
VAVLPEAQVIHHGGATIGRLDGALGSGTHPGLLWSDLLRWAAKHAGDPLARRCKWALLAGARLRIGWRQLTAPGRGAAWRHDTAALAAALHALEAPAGVASLQPRETR